MELRRQIAERSSVNGFIRGIILQESSGNGLRRRITLQKGHLLLAEDVEWIHKKDGLRLYNGFFWKRLKQAKLKYELNL